MEPTVPPADSSDCASPQHPQAFDPLGALRAPTDPPFDLFVCGTVYLDIVFTGLASSPSPGTEVWAEGMGSCPGGVANLGVAASRLGLRTSLAAAFGDDDYGEFCWRTLESQEHIDLSASRRYTRWHSPVTVSIAHAGDRSMITHQHAPPERAAAMITTPPRSRVVMVELSPHMPLGSADEPTWMDTAAAAGAKLFADVGWDPTGQWSTSVLDQLQYCYAFMPNAVEAMAYTRTSSPYDALFTLADRVPLAIVTNGAAGALAVDATTNEEASVPALRVREVDATGAGDVFGAAVTLGTLAQWPLADRLAFGSLCSALAVQQVGGSLAAPGWGDIADWWRHVRDAPGHSAYDASVKRRYAFLDAIVPQVPCSAVRRAQATVARRSDA